ncbi:MAG: hypothetical protein JW931_07415 [Methanomicrobiaceae archaeon]|nr:hypothetical protein [Methanomicrobiaceae archaeon]
MKIRRENRQYEMEENPPIIPGPLSITINIGLIVTESSFNHENVKRAIKESIYHLEDILSKTPHNYKFILPYMRGGEHIIIESLLADPLWNRRRNPEVELLNLPGELSVQNKPFEGAVKYKLKFARKDGATPGFDPVYDTVIDNSNLALLVGEWEPGATQYRKGSIFSLARRYGRTIVAINPDSGQCFRMNHDDRIFESYKNLNTYNTEDLKKDYFLAKQKDYMGLLELESEKAGLPEHHLKDIYASLLPNYSRAKLLARKYRRLYSYAGTLISVLAALAVLTITLQTLFFPKYPELVWLEVAEIAMIIILMSATRYGEYHRKWMDYNFLAERIRAAFFVSIVCVTCKSPDTPPHMSLAHRPNDWMVMAFGSITSLKSSSFCRLNIPFEPMKKFIKSAWIANRLEYYIKESERTRKNYKYLATLGELLFGLVLIFAIIHATGVAHWELHVNLSVSLFLAYLTITLPAVGSAIAAIRVQREYLRNSERYAHVVRHLTSIRNAMKYVSTMNELCSLLEEMNEITLREQQDWRIIFRFRRLEAA